jgi:DNA-binding MurR/RpiR family transcriptional regulator
LCAGAHRETVVDTPTLDEATACLAKSPRCYDIGIGSTGAGASARIDPNKGDQR